MQYVVVNGQSSSTTRVLSGVPQESGVGPLLFLVYTSDLSYLMLTEGIELLLYADDILVYRPIKNELDYRSL